MNFEDQISASPQPYTFRLKGKSNRSFLFLKMAPISKEFTIRPMSLGTMSKISRLIVKISKNILITEGDSILFHAHKLSEMHANTIAEIISIAIEPRQPVRQARIESMLLNHTTAAELEFLLVKVITLMDMPTFLNSIVNVIGLSITPRGGRIATDSEISEIKNVDKTR